VGGERVHTRILHRFLGLRYILTHWREEILNYFFPVTNGFAEGKSGRSKVIIRSGYGYYVLENPSLQILMTNHSSSYAAALCQYHTS